MFLGAAIIFVTLLPLNAWLAKRGDREIPLLAMHGLFYAICFGVAGFFTIPSRFLLTRVDEASYTLALSGALLSWLMVCAGYRLGQMCRPHFAMSILRVDSPRLDRLAVLVLYPASVLALLLINGFELSGLLEIGIAARLFAFVWILHAAWSDKLPANYRYAVLILMVPTELLLFSGFENGLLVGLLVYGQVIGITYALTRRRIPVVAAVIVTFIFGFFTPVKNEYRSMTWGAARQVGALEGARIFSGLAWQYYTAGSSGPSAKESFEQIYIRMDHLHTVAAVISDTPASEPYRYGETMLPLLTKWVPRAFWPDKPREDFGNRWGREYGYLGSTDYVTSYNLPWVAEMYMNFGWVGLAALSFGIGALMGALWGWLIASSSGSVQFAFALTMAKPFFFPESNISMQIGGLIVSTVSVLVLMIALLGITARTRVPRRGAQTTCRLSAH